MIRTAVRLAATLALLVLAAASAPGASAAGPSAEVSALVGTPPSGKALVVFYRPSKFVGGAIGFKVREGEKVLGKLSNGKYFVSTVEPGKHTYVVHSESKDVFNLEVEAGETYFVSGAMGFGLVVGRPNLSPSDAAAFEKVMKKLKLAKPVAPGDKDEDEPAAKDAAPKDEPAPAADGAKDGAPGDGDAGAPQRSTTP